MRKAFLDLDFDHDGFITAEDILRYFGKNTKEIDLSDLIKIIKERDSTKEGRLNYSDFSRWLGSVIH